MLENTTLPDNAAKLHGEINISLNKFEDLLEGLRNSGRLKTLKKLLENRPSLPAK